MTENRVIASCFALAYREHNRLACLRIVFKSRLKNKATLAMTAEGGKHLLANNSMTMMTCKKCVRPGFAPQLPHRLWILHTFQMSATFSIGLADAISTMQAVKEVQEELEKVTLKLDATAFRGRHFGLEMQLLRSRLALLSIHRWQLVVS